MYIEIYVWRLSCNKRPFFAGGACVSPYYLVNGPYPVADNQMTASSEHVYGDGGDYGPNKHGSTTYSLISLTTLTTQDIGQLLVHQIQTNIFRYCL